MSGKNNEDRFAISAFRLSKERPLPVVFAIVSDGIGGHRAGEIAAEIAVETISQTVAASDASNPIDTLQQAIIQASHDILAQAENDAERKGMGATCACSWIIDNKLYIAYVGDSRIYLLRDNVITQISNDHTWVQEAIDAGLLTPDQGRKHPNAHIIRRYLGSRSPVTPDIRLRLAASDSDVQAEANQGLPLLPGDQLLMCSDGLTDLVEDHEILQALTEKEPEEALEYLIDLANQRGGHDNITLTNLRIPANNAQTHLLPGRARLKSRLPWPLNHLPKWPLSLTCLAITAAITVLALVALAGVYLLVKPAASTPTPGNYTATAPLILPAETLTPPASTPFIQATDTPSSPGVTPLAPTHTYTLWPTITDIPPTP